MCIPRVPKLGHWRTEKRSRRENRAHCWETEMAAQWQTESNCCKRLLAAAGCDLKETKRQSENREKTEHTVGRKKLQLSGKQEAMAANGFWQPQVAI